MMFRTPSSHASPDESLSTPPQSPSKKQLGVAGVANIFIKMRRRSPASLSSSVPSSPEMPPQPLHHDKQPKQQGKPHHIESLSGPAPQSHPGVAEAASPKRASLAITDVFVCVGGVNLPTLLRASRGSLVEQAEAMGANALVDELWKCTISSPKQRSNGTFRVQIRYTAQATRSTAPDPHKPVALSSARGVPGLMTILRRTH